MVTKKTVQEFLLFVGNNLPDDDDEAGVNPLFRVF
ncbi:hypothetical protein X734_02555 [Mesorhizobium sp. L2C084A000]|nr:hypothetical protein X734_02555 [Mesorhizobium sp. L2C084A000]